MMLATLEEPPNTEAFNMRSHHRSLSSQTKISDAPAAGQTLELTPMTKFMGHLASLTTAVLRVQLTMANV